MNTKLFKELEQSFIDGFIKGYENDYWLENDSIGGYEYGGASGRDNQDDYGMATYIIEIRKDEFTKGHLESFLDNADSEIGLVDFLDDYCHFSRNYSFSNSDLRVIEKDSKFEIEIDAHVVD